MWSLTHDNDRYLVSDHGDVFSLISNKVLKPRIHSNGYHQVNLCANGKATNYYIHILVAAAFLGPRPAGMDVCHNDGDKTNNAVSNLRYDTRSNNILDSVATGAHHAASRIHCPRNHAYDEQNTYISPKGGRVCRKCRNLAKRQRNQSSQGETTHVHGFVSAC